MDSLRESYYFENLDDEQFAKLTSISHKKHYEKNSIVFYEKEHANKLLLLIEGTLKVYKTDLKNNEIIMHRFYPTSMVAEVAVLEGIPYPASGAFETAGVIIEIDFEKFKKEFFSNPDIAVMFFKSLSKKIKYLEDVISLNIVLDSTARLAKFLCDNKDELDTLKNYDLAKRLHMTPETLSRTFKKLMVLGLIEKGKSKYTVLNEVGLQVLFE